MATFIRQSVGRPLITVASRSGTQSASGWDLYVKCERARR